MTTVIIKLLMTHKGADLLDDPTKCLLYKYIIFYIHIKGYINSYIKKITKLVTISLLTCQMAFFTIVNI